MFIEHIVYYNAMTFSSENKLKIHRRTSLKVRIESNDFFDLLSVVMSIFDEAHIIAVAGTAVY